MNAEPAISAEAPVHADAGLTGLAVDAAKAAQALMREARGVLAGRVSASGRVSGRMLEAEQYAAHGLAWLATYGASLDQMAGWATRLEAGDRFGEIERLILVIGFGEYLSQIAGGIPEMIGKQPVRRYRGSFSKSSA